MNQNFEVTVQKLMKDLVGCTITRFEYVETGMPQIAHRYHSGNFLFLEAIKPDGTYTGFSVCDGCDPITSAPSLSVFTRDESLVMFDQAGIET